MFTLVLGEMCAQPSREARGKNSQDVVSVKKPDYVCTRHSLWALVLVFCCGINT